LNARLAVNATKRPPAGAYRFAPDPIAKKKNKNPRQDFLFLCSFSFSSRE
jgi:hypothetical protein